MRASAEPAALMRPETSDIVVELESKELFGECVVAIEMDDFAESMEEVRGACPKRKGDP